MPRLTDEELKEAEEAWAWASNSFYNITELLSKNKELARKLEEAETKIKKVSDLAEPYLLKYNITHVLSTESLPKIIENICEDIKKFTEIYADSLIDDLGDLEPDSAGIDFLSGIKRQIIYYIDKGVKL